MTAEQGVKEPRKPAAWAQGGKGHYSLAWQLLVYCSRSWERKYVGHRTVW